MKPGIQILNYNGMKWLPGLMESLSQVRSAETILYVVDNASTDDSLQWLEEHYPQVRIIRHHENLGYAEAYNRSIPVALADGCDWVCLLNTDTTVSPDWLEALTIAAEDPAIGIMGPVFTKWDSDQPNYYMDGRCADVIPYMFDDTRSPVDRDWVEGSALFVRRECFEQTGGMNPMYFMYWEEADLCRRARRHGWRVVVVPGSVCRHYAGGSGPGNGPGFLQLRNHFIYSLTDPFHGFAKNVLTAARLSLTYCKQAVWDHPSVARAGLLAKALWSTTWQLGACYLAWQQARLSARS